jgi:hypothetical protein
MYFGKALGLAELQRMISQGLLHKLLCSGLLRPSLASGARQGV